MVFTQLDHIGVTTFFEHGVIKGSIPDLLVIEDAFTCKTREQLTHFDFQS